MRPLGNSGIFQFWRSARHVAVDCNGYWIPTAGRGLLVDPPGLADEDLPSFEHRGGIGAVLLTSADRLDTAREIAAQFDAQVIEPGDPLPAGFRRVDLPIPSRCQEIALLHEPSGALFLGPAFMAAPAGKISAGPGVKPEEFRKNILTLGELPIAMALPAYGLPITSGARQVVRQALSLDH